MDQIRERRDRPREREGRGLCERRRAEHREVDRDGIDPFAGTHDRAIDEAVRVAVTTRKVGVAAAIICGVVAEPVQMRLVFIGPTSSLERRCA